MSSPRLQSSCGNLADVPDDFFSYSDISSDSDDVSDDGSDDKSDDDSDEHPSQPAISVIAPDSEPDVAGLQTLELENRQHDEILLAPSADVPLSFEDAISTGNEQAVIIHLANKDEHLQLDGGLVTAACEGKGSIATLLLDAGANKNHKDEYGRTPLHWAAHGSHSDIVRILLLRYGALDCKDNHGDTALSLAASSRNLEIVKLLLDAGASVRTKNNDRKTPLHEPAFEDAVDIVDLLLSKGAELTVDPSRLGNNLLEQLCHVEAPNTIRLLLNRSWRIDKVMLSNCFYNALCSGNPRTITLLREYEPDLNLKSSEPRYGSALQDFAFNGRINLVRELLERPMPADVNKTGGKFHTALIATVCEPGKSPYIGIDSYRRRQKKSVARRQKMFEYLNNKGADWTLSGGAYGTVLGASVLRASPELMEYVLSKVPATLEDHEGRSAAHLISNDMRNREEKFKILLKYVDRESLDRKDMQRRMPLHFACSHSFLFMVKYLLKGKEPTCINMVDIDGWTPLHWACRGGHAQVVNLLLRKGADIGARTNEKDWMPWHVAQFHDKLDILPKIRPADQNDGSPLVMVAQRHINIECDSCDMVSIFHPPSVDHCFLTNCTARISGAQGTPAHNA